MTNQEKGESILTEYMGYCLICGKPKQATHHLLSGIANRKLSDNDRVVIPLCNEHHTGKRGLHTIREFEVLGKIIGQLAWEKNYVINKLVREHVDKREKSGLDWNKMVTEERISIATEAREAFRDRYGKSLL